MRKLYKQRSHESCEIFHGLMSEVPGNPHLNTTILELLQLRSHSAGSDINNLLLINERTPRST